jgi:mannose-6-phosphate isomerase-like protein (cupin superfamily)
MRELIGDSPDRRVEILFEHDALHVTWSRYGPHRDGADPHIHRLHTDLFYVLDGELTLRLETGDVVVPAGTLATIPPLVVHGFRNASDADVRYLNLHAPGTGFADYMRGLRDGRRVAFDQEPPPPDGTRPASDITLAATERIEIDGAPRCLYVLDGDRAGAWIETDGPVEGATRAVEIRA